MILEERHMSRNVEIINTMADGEPPGAMRLLQLPFDILDKLSANFLPIPDLKSCSLACRNLHYIARPHLQRNICIRYEQAHQVFATGERVRAEFPPMTSNIRRLTIRRNTISSNSPDLEQALLELLPSMRNLSTLVITGEYANSFIDPRGGCLVLGKLTSHYHLFPSIRSLVFHHLVVDVPLEIFGAFPNLDTLTLDGVNFSEQRKAVGASGDMNQPQLRPAIRKLSIRLERYAASQFIQWACNQTACSLDLTGIKVLYWSLESYQNAVTDLCDSFLSLLGSTIETLDLHYYGSAGHQNNGHRIPHIPNVAVNLPSLRVLRFQPEGLDYPQGLSSAIPAYSHWLPIFLPQFNICQQLKTIKIYCSFIEDAVLGFDEEAASAELAGLWHCVDDSFTALPYLGEVTFYLAGLDENVEEIEALLQKRLPRLFFNTLVSTRVCTVALPSECWTRVVLFPLDARDMG